jgi:hypothetical protein
MALVMWSLHVGKGLWLSVAVKAGNPECHIGRSYLG